MGQYFLYDKILPILNQNEFIVKIKEGNRHLLLAELEEENIDMVFSNSKDSLASNMIAYRLGSNKTYVVAHKKFRKLKKTFPESLIEIPYFGYTDETTLKFEIELFFSQLGISPRLVGEADDADLLEVITKNGLAFTIVPEVTKNRFLMNKDVMVLGEIKE
ncbi:LysR substrate-binding domain-containing protein, partial [Bacteriovoracaceae bacterium]|nr:LysR substrate-binding domain-containing protein [Bacteriovoracaceae bacterium]